MRSATILRGRRHQAALLLALIAAVAACPAHARHYYTRHAQQEGGSGPPYAAIVVDANNGAVLHAANPDELRHPASLTKIMTLYLLFERLEAGKLKLDTPLEVSSHAAAQSPTKLGLKPGETIDVDNAIRGLVTRSANDAAVVIAEAIAGSESDFANMMTHQAHALGMSRTVYRNASGLPDDDQVTTARDQALLGRAIQERFPKYYHYFSLPAFTYRGVTIANHDNLLGRVEGVDGIKTGYTQASGFNLVSSVHRNNHYLVAVVMGGSSAGARDARMRSLIEEYISAGSTQKTAPPIGEAAAHVADGRTALPRSASTESRAAEPSIAKPAVRAATRPDPTAVYAVASYSRPIPWPKAQANAAAHLAGPATPQTPAPPADANSGAAAVAVVAQGAAPAPLSTTANARESAAASRSDEPLRPIPVKTLKVKLPAAQVAELAPPVAPPATAAPARPEQPAESGSIAAVAGARFAAAVEPGEPRREASRDNAIAGPAFAVHSGWIIQVGAFDDEREARDKLNAAQSKASVLAHADPFTETVVKGDKTFYRARFAGLHRDEAETACRQLRRNDIDCMTVRN